MKLASFISGIFGVLGFALSLLAGVAADNTLEAILTHALLCAFACYVVGYGVGMIAQQVSLEHARAISKAAAAEDEETERKRQEGLAAEAAASAESAAASAAAVK